MAAVISTKKGEGGLAPFEIALCGATAGVASRVIIAPLDVIKIRLQTQAHVNPEGKRHAPKYHGVLYTMRLIIKEEGLLGLWKGNFFALLLYMSYGAVQFTTYREMEKIFGSYSTDHYLRSGIVTFVSGAISGTTATIVTYPFDLFRTRFSVQGNTKTYTGLIQAFRYVAKTDGIRGFYGGLTPTVLQIIPSMGLMYYSYEALKALTNQIHKSFFKSNDGWLTRDVEKTICGGTAGLISKLGTMPFDVLRKRLQVQNKEPVTWAVGHVPKYKNIRDCIQKTYAHEGIKGFYRGLIPALLKTAPASATTFLVFEKSQELLLLWHSENNQRT